METPNPQEPQNALQGGRTFRDLNVVEKQWIVGQATALIEFRTTATQPGEDGGTGFLLPGGWLLTCWHVIPTETRARDAAIYFGARRNREGWREQGKPIKLAPDKGFFTGGSQGVDDWTLVRLDASADALRPWGHVVLDLSLTVKPGDEASIIQHPGLKPAKIAEGTLQFTGTQTFTYAIETEKGSSGAPVLNAHSDVIALHSRGNDSQTNAGIPMARIVEALKAKENSPWPEIERLGREVELKVGIVQPPRLTPTQVLWPTKLRHAADCLVGRETELALLHQAWDAPETHLFVIRGKGGEGKTALVAAWMAEMAAKDWRGAERVLDWSFYSQGTRDQTAATAEVFLHDALEHLGAPDPNAGDATARAARLAKLIGEQRCLLVLDGLEPLQYPPGPLHGALKDPGMAALLRGLAARNAGLCVVTTRERVVEVEAHYGKSAVDHELQFLSPLAGAQLLHHSGARRAGKKAIAADDKELQDASREVQGHALTLSLIGQYLKLMEAGKDGDIRQRDRMKLAEADREYTNDATRPYGHAFKAMEAYERWFADGDAAARRQLAALRLLGLFDRPAPADCLGALRGGDPIPGLTEEWTGTRATDWNIALSRLQEINLVSVGEDGAVDCHPLLREYFAMRLKEKHPEAFRAGHSRLFDHLCASTEHLPDTLAGLQPLYQAVTHGCLAGRQQEACENIYVARILRGTGPGGNYSTFKLGAIGADLGAVAAFFDEPWRRPSPHLSAPDQAWLLNEAAYSLRALGRLSEAVEPIRVTLEINAKSEEWKNAAVVASTLSQLEVTLGRLGEAVADGRRAIEFADRSGEDDWQNFIRTRTTAADALHQAGERAEASPLFAKAERMQAESQPFPLLYSLRGFQYADLLLAPAERAAWQKCGAGVPPAVPAKGGLPPELGAETAAPLSAIAEAERRAKQTLEWLEAQYPLLDIALAHLTQARAALYRALLTPDPPFDIRHSTFGIPTALAKLRAANSLDHLPKALLTAAFYHGTLGGDPAEAARLLDEAQQIAERGPMPLYLADVHLHRARFAGMRKDEWRMPNGEAVDAKAELAKARELIEKHGYWRRREELKDAQAASVHW